MTVTKDPLTALYEKMAAEQGQYRKWLMEQSPGEILNHAREFAVREDILMEVGDMELSDERATALLKSLDPLTDIYTDWSKRDSCSHMEDIADTITARADDVIKMVREQKKADKER